MCEQDTYNNNIYEKYNTDYCMVENSQFSYVPQCIERSSILLLMVDV